MDNELSCPPVTIRAGASTYAVGAPGKEAVGNDLRYQATISRTARDCTKTGDQITARIGILGRVIVGPAGAPQTVEIPLRVAVVQGGVQEKTIATKVYRTTVTMNDQNSVPFSLVAEDVIYPVPPGATGDSYIFYIGFDPQALTPEPAPARERKKHGESSRGAAKSRRDRLAPAVVDLSKGIRQFSFARTSAMPLASRSSAIRALDRLRHDGGGRRHRGIGRGGTDVGQRLGLGQRDLALGGLGAAGDKIFHLGLGLGRDALGLGFRRGDDVLRLALGAGVAGLVLGEQLGGLVLETAGVVELGLDAVAAVIERLSAPCGGRRNRRIRPSG